jgi:hypothetical protein
MSNTAQGPVVEIKRQPRELTQHFNGLVSGLQAWRNADHEDAITLHRDSIIELLEGIETLKTS